MRSWRTAQYSNENSNDSLDPVLENIYCPEVFALSRIDDTLGNWDLSFDAVFISRKAGAICYPIGSNFIGSLIIFWSLWLCIDREIYVFKSWWRERRCCLWSQRRDVVSGLVPTGGLRDRCHLSWTLSDVKLFHSDKERIVWKPCEGYNIRYSK